MGRAVRWRARGATLEAMMWLAGARFLVARVAFKRWRRWLGAPVAPLSMGRGARLDENLSARGLARAVERAAARLPGESRCLPRAMALRWLLRRRGIAATMVIGVRAGSQRGGLDDLHAWIVRSGEVLIGASEDAHIPIYAAS